MAETAYPFDDTPAATEIEWSRLARIWMPDGVDGAANGTSLRVTAGAGLTVNVAVGNAVVRGIYYRNDATKSVGLAINNASTARIDRIVVRVDTTTNTGSAIAITGTPAASPVPPNMTYTEATFDLPLAEVRVEANDTISTVTDRRRFVGRPPVSCLSTNRPDPQGRFMLAHEEDTKRVVYTSGDGNWVVGMGSDIFRPLYAYSGDPGTSASITWDSTLTDSNTPTLSLTFSAPPSGLAFVHIGAFLRNNSAGDSAFVAARMVDSTNAAYWAAADSTSTADRQLQLTASGVNDGASCAATYYAGSLVPQRQYTVTLRYRVSGGTGTFDKRFIKIDPLP